MSTDVILESDGRDDWVAIEARVVNAKASDLMLDAPDRRLAGGGPRYRRALVHNQRDGLTVNFNQDYPGGLTLNGVAELVPKAPAGGGIAPERLRTVPDLVVRGGIQFIWEETGLLAGQRERAVTVQGLLTALQAQVDELSGRVAALEAR